jgi:hypothetical protein
MKYLLGILFCLLLLLCKNSYGQDITLLRSQQGPYPYIPDAVFKLLPDSLIHYGSTDGYSDSLYQIWAVHSRQRNCKADPYAYIIAPAAETPVVFIADALPFEEKLPGRKPFLTVHGNVLYNMDYRSNIDTPYAEKDVYQHTIQTYLDITVKDQYPIRLYFTNRFSNSSLFRNFADLNLQYNPNEFSNKIKQQIKEKIKASLSVDSLRVIRKLLLQNVDLLNALQTGIKKTAQLQRMVEDRERQLYGDVKAGSGSNEVAGLLRSVDMTNEEIAEIKKGRLPGRLEAYFNDTAKPEGSFTKMRDSIRQEQPDWAAVQQKKDSILGVIVLLQDAYRKRKNFLEQYQRNLDGAVDKITTVSQLRQKLDELHIADSSLPKGYKTLWSLKSLSVGRSIVNYSELSAKNISITGVQGEFNPSYYLAVASGAVDYRFRDYVVQRSSGPRQYLNLVRAGWGNKDGNNIILTYYTGKRQLYNSATTIQNGAIPNYNLMGFTVEGNYKLNETTYLTAELAKSSLPYYNRDAGDKGLLAGTLRFSDHTNEAYSLKLATAVPQTDTRIDGYYKHFGANFQSFSLFTTGAEQDAWMVRVNQNFFRRRLSLTASVKQNDYTNPFVDHAYNSKTLFKSLQATLRLPKWPVISLGYFPSSQLTKTGDDQYTENLFYTLVGNMSYNYHVAHTMMNSTLTYTQFYNKATDSNFVYFNTRNLMLNHAIFWRRFTYQTTASFATNTEYNLYMWDHDVLYAIRQWLSIGGGIKYNRQTVYNIEQLGYKYTAILKLKKIGEIQLLYDKGFIPGVNRQLIDNKIGRVSFFKIF